MSYARLVDVVRHAPGRGAVHSALNTLRLLARDADLDATLALTGIVAGELRLAGAAVPDRLDSPTELLTVDMPEFARAYALGYFPGLLVDHGPTLSRAYRTPDPNDYDTVFRTFRGLAVRHAPVRDEALRAVLLHILTYQSTVLDRVQSQMSAVYHKAIHRIATGARVVPGADIDTEFEVGLELIRRIPLGGLVGMTLHEFGHYWVNHYRRPGSVASELAALAEQVPALLATAERLIGVPETPEDPRHAEIGGGLVVICSRDRVGDGVYTHFSFSAHGAIRLTPGAQCALLALRGCGVDPTRAAAAYSVNGVFHVGFLDEPVPTVPAVDQARTRVRSAEQWLDALYRTGLLGRDETDIYRSLGMARRQQRFYCTDPARFATVWERLSPYLGDGEHTQPDPADLPALVSASVSLGTTGILRGALDSGGAVDDVALLLADLGTANAVLREPERTVWLGPDAQACRETLAELNHAGHGLDVAVHPDGSTLLVDAATRDVALVDFLLGLGADIDCPDRAGTTPLLAAIDAERADVALRLVEAGARTDATDPDGESPLHRACRAGLSTVVSALLERGADVDAPTHAGHTPLMVSAEEGHLDVVSELLARGADPNGTTVLGMTPLHYAAISTADASRGHVIDVLVAAGADVDEENNDGLTPLDCARRGGRPTAVAALLAAGATDDEAAA